MIQNTLFRTQSTQEIITYALEEHDPGSAQDWRTLSDLTIGLWRPVSYIVQGFEK